MSRNRIVEQPLNRISEIDSDEANLLWDEYKYRHDLIWRHLIRSTVAVVALITISYSDTFAASNKTLYIIAALLAIIYTSFSFSVLNSELRLYENIKMLHRQRQKERYKLHTDKRDLKGGFSTRARLYMAGLLLLALAAALIQVLGIDGIWQ